MLPGLPFLLLLLVLLLLLLFLLEFMLAVPLSPVLLCFAFFLELGDALIFLPNDFLLVFCELDPLNELPLVPVVVHCVPVQLLRRIDLVLQRVNVVFDALDLFLILLFDVRWVPHFLHRLVFCLFYALDFGDLLIQLGFVNVDLLVQLGQLLLFDLDHIFGLALLQLKFVALSGIHHSTAHLVDLLLDMPRLFLRQLFGDYCAFELLLPGLQLGIRHKLQLRPCPQIVVFIFELLHPVQDLPLLGYQFREHLPGLSPLAL